MAQFLYHLPGAAGLLVSDEQLAAAGLDYAFAGLGGARETAPAAGPAGPGLLVRPGAGDGEPPLCYAPEEQSWEGGVGFWLRARPGPEDLRRPDCVAGHELTLGDGRRWLLPVARFCPEGCALPATLRLGPGGLSRAVTPEYAGLWADACRLWESPEALDEAGKWWLALRCLAVNYRVAAPEANLLGLFTTANLERVLGVLVDLPTWLAVQEEAGRLKKAAAGAAGPGTPAGSPSGSGSPASCPATPPPSPTAAGCSGSEG